MSIFVSNSFNRICIDVVCICVFIYLCVSTNGIVDLQVVTNYFNISK